MAQIQSLWFFARSPIKIGGLQMVKVWGTLVGFMFSLLYDQESISWAWGGWLTGVLIWLSVEGLLSAECAIVLSKS